MRRVMPGIRQPGLLERTFTSRRTSACGSGRCGPWDNSLFLLLVTVVNRIPTWRQRLRAWTNSGNVGVFLSASESSVGFEFLGLQATSLFLLLFLLPGLFLGTFLGGRSR